MRQKFGKGNRIRQRIYCKVFYRKESIKEIQLLTKLILNDRFCMNDI